MFASRIAKILLLLFVVALSLRVAGFVAMKRWNAPNDIEHRQLAVSLIENGSFRFRDFGYIGPSSVQSPPYPVLLAGAFKVFGTQVNSRGIVEGTDAAYIAMMLLNSLAGAAATVLTFHMARELGASERVAITAAALMAIWPSQVYAVGHVQAISLITLCFIATVFLFLRATRTSAVGPWIGFSIVGCLGALTEPVLLPIMALTGLLILVWPKLTTAVRFRNAGILLASAIVIIIPWTIRNRVVHGAFVPIKTTFWVNVWKSANDEATGTDRVELSPELREMHSASVDDSAMLDPKFDAPRQYAMLTPQQVARLKGKPEIEREKIFQEFAQTWIKENRQRWVELCFIRLYKTVWIDLDNPKANNLIYVVTRSVLVLATAIGLVMAWRAKWRLVFPVLLVGSCWLTYTLTITAARFGIPIEPMQLTLLALIVVTVLSRREVTDQQMPLQTATARRIEA